MYGVFKPPLALKLKNFHLRIRKDGDLWAYKRKTFKEEKELALAFSGSEIIINPVEPVNLPKEISSYLLIEFDNPLILGPKERVRVYVTFPIEIGVIISKGKNYRVLDIFSFTKQKYTLYGDVRKGIVCKYWKSHTYTKIPKTDPLKEGIMELLITNTTEEWLDVKEAVFNAYGMKIYYNKTLVSMKAAMKVFSEEVAETSFVDSPLTKDMKKSIEVYVAKKMMFPIQKEKFVMEEGV
jgi:hypothetical protein